MEITEEQRGKLLNLIREMRTTRGLPGKLYDDYQEALNLLKSQQPEIEIIVTRCKGLPEALRGRGFVRDDVRVVKCATLHDVSGRHVLGDIPLGLATQAKSITKVILDLDEGLPENASAAWIDPHIKGIQTFVVRWWRDETCVQADGESP